MPSIPLPFVISLLLLIVLLRMIRLGEDRLGLFPLLVVVFAIQATLTGLNWNFGWYPAHVIQPIVAAIIPAIAFAAFDLLRRNGQVGHRNLTLHLMPALLVTFLVIFWRAPIDIVLFVIYLGYGLALVRIARQGPDALISVRIADEWNARQALIAMAMLLIATTFIDAIISFNFSFGDGKQAKTILAVASVLWLAGAGYAAIVADSARPDSEEKTAPEDSSSLRPTSTHLQDDEAIVNRVHAVMREKHLYRDPDLTLERLARRVGIPSRQISGALNRIYGRNISQFVNEYRVNDAKRRLSETNDPVTRIMFESGFGTKSNFNREFMRVVGMTPNNYRRAARALDMTTGTSPS